MTVSDLADRLKASVLDVTKDWAKQRKAEERHASAAVNRRARLIRASDYYNFKSAASEVMEEAYLKASANGTLPASARQVMYQARPFIQEKMNGQPLNDQYFCQQLLPDYMQEHGVDWDIVYDDRGHFFEPHTGHSFGLGTISVREYLADVTTPKLAEPGFAAGKVKTHGPGGCFGAVLFIEKEGFLPLFEKVQLGKRYDLAIMSTKGMSSTAARSLIDNLCRKQVPLLALHDFDKAGLSIAGTLKRSTRRFSFEHNAKIIDLGLRLADVRDLDLEASAEDAFDRGSDFAKQQNLRLNGATEEEVEFLLTQRVELNALTSDQLVEFIEGKLDEHATKVIPQADLLGNAYRLFVNSARLEKIVEKAIRDIGDRDDPDAPVDLGERVTEYLRQHPESRWDAAVAAIADEDDPDEGIDE
jgi:hypothetical protein